MAKKNTFTSALALQKGHKNILYLFIVLTLAAQIISVIIWPFVISLDSIFGFLAYKGTLQTNKYNVISVISDKNINIIRSAFVSWWSPGQWVFPGIFNYLFGWKLGVGSILTTAISSIIGIWGYYRLFRHFNFSSNIALASIAGILISSTFYYCYVIYQGGEILQFAVFPWFFLYAARLQVVTIRSMVVLCLLLALCFIAKTTLVLYCAIIMLSKIFWLEFEIYDVSRKVRLSNLSFTVFFITIAYFFCVQYFFLRKGPHPPIFIHFNWSLRSFSVPLSSPLISLFSIQEWLIRTQKIIMPFGVQTQLHHFANAAIQLLPMCIVSLLLIKLFSNNKIDRTYKQYFFLLYIFVSVFFIISYLNNTKIDLGSRHFKLLGYFFLPALLLILKENIKFKFVNAALILFAFVAIADFVYLKNKWTFNRYISINYFYRNNIGFTNKDNIDLETYKKIIALDKTSEKSALFLIEGTDDLSIDLQHTCFLKGSAFAPGWKKYFSKGPNIYSCINKDNLIQNPFFLQYKFPDYKNHIAIDSTKQFIFFRSAPN